MEKLNNVDVYVERYGQKLIDFIPNLLGAIAILIVGWWLIKMVNRLVRKYFKKKEFDLTLENFIASLINYGLKILLFVVVITQLGVESASFVAILGAAGLAIGLALQGSLSNFAGGVLILILKPFKIGDFIKAQGLDGTVKEISIFHTRLLTFNNQLAILPNGKIMNENIINFTVEGIRKDAITIGISYDSDIKLAREILLNLVNEQPQTIQDEGKKPVVYVAELGDSSVNLSLRFWAINAEFWDLHFLIMEESKMRLESAGISIPFPQRDVHHFNLES